VLRRAFWVNPKFPRRSACWIIYLGFGGARGELLTT
jgi:hypothetical protein